jgi:hypothetical protein
LYTDLTRDGLYAAVDRFIKTAPINGTGFVYFRGDVTTGTSFDERETPVLLGIGGDAKGLTLIELMEWLHLHSAAARHVIVLDDCRGTPQNSGMKGPYGISETDVPANVWLGFGRLRDNDDSPADRRRSVFVEKLSTSSEADPSLLLSNACGWTKTTCREGPFSETASHAVAPPDEFPGTCSPGDEWVSPDGTVFCYCPPGEAVTGFWIGKYEVPLCKWPIPGFFGGIGAHRNDPTNRQRTEDVLARLVALTSAEREAGRIPANWEYGLPTPEQWEHAARAGSSGDRYFEDAAIAHHANIADQSLFDTGQEEYLYADRSLNDGTAELAPVGTYLPNAWGIHDVYGNVWEQTDTGVLCGGSWVSLPDYCRATVRKPPLRFPTDYVGLRIVLRPVASNGQANELEQR